MLHPSLMVSHSCLPLHLFAQQPSCYRHYFIALNIREHLFSSLIAFGLAPTKSLRVKTDHYHPP